MSAARTVPAEVRPFRRSDRDQLTELVNAHVEAVLPGVTLPPNAVLGQLAVFRPPAHVRDPAQVDADADALVRVGPAVVAAGARRHAGRPDRGRDPLAAGRLGRHVGAVGAPRPPPAAASRPGWWG